MTDRGIDYGMGRTNIDTKTGIRFGIISAHDLAHWFYDQTETIYHPHCPACGADLDENWPDTDWSDNADEDEDAADTDYTVCTNDDGENFCPHCKAIIGDGDQYGDEPSATIINDPAYRGHVGSDGDVWLCRSPFYTRAAFCSPCAPGAGSLRAPCDDGAKTYCFGASWFENGRAPYPVFAVADDRLIETEEQENAAAAAAVAADRAARGLADDE